MKCLLSKSESKATCGQIQRNTKSKSKATVTVAASTKSAIRSGCGHKGSLGKASRRVALAGPLLLGGSVALDQSAVAMSTRSSGIEQILDDPKYPPKWPFSAADFARPDESPDAVFYSYPRLVTHIDDFAIKALTNFYAAVLPPSGRPDTAVLDLCSSWVSHYPAGYVAGKVSGVGMNGEELKRNLQLTDWVVQDLNADPKLPYADNTFDAITNCVSVDYLNKPLEIFQEMHRVLKPGGAAYMSFSNRCFPTKAVGIWGATGDADHVWLVGSYYHYSVPQGWTPPKCKDISPNPGRSDPMYVVYASKQA